MSKKIYCSDLAVTPQKCSRKIDGIISIEGFVNFPWPNVILFLSLVF